MANERWPIVECRVSIVECRLSMVDCTSVRRPILGEFFVYLHTAMPSSIPSAAAALPPKPDRAATRLCDVDLHQTAPGAEVDVDEVLRKVAPCCTPPLLCPSSPALLAPPPLSQNIPPPPLPILPYPPSHPDAMHQLTTHAEEQEEDEDDDEDEVGGGRREYEIWRYRCRVPCWFSCHPITNASAAANWAMDQSSSSTSTRSSASPSAAPSCDSSSGLAVSELNSSIASDAEFAVMYLTCTLPSLAARLNANCCLT